MKVGRPRFSFKSFLEEKKDNLLQCIIKSLEALKQLFSDLGKVASYFFKASNQSVSVNTDSKVRAVFTRTVSEKPDELYAVLSRIHCFLDGIIGQITDKQGGGNSGMSSSLFGKQAESFLWR